jgi:hypothetical protein
MLKKRQITRIFGFPHTENKTFILQKSIVSRCLHVVSDPTVAEIKALSKAADTKDLPILAAVVRESCVFLTTYNIRHFQPGTESVTVLNLGDLVQRVRYLLAQMSSE